MPAANKRPYTQREPAIELACPQCGGAFTRKAWRVRQAQRMGQTLYCGYDCAHSSRRFRTPEYLAEYHQSYRERNRERIRENAKKERFGEKREHVLARSRAIYQRNIEANRARAREYGERHKEERRARSKAWPSQNPDRALYHQARSNLAASIGLKPAMIPEELALVKVEQIKVIRLAKAMSASGQDQNAQKPDSITRKDLPDD